LSAIIYLKRAGLLSIEGIKRKKRYLIVLYSTTVVVNLFMVYLILPAAANLTNRKTDTNISTAAAVVVKSGTQVVNMTQMPGGYKPNQFTVKVGVPVKWVIDAQNPDTCSGSIMMQSENIKKDLVLGENVIEFTPKKTGDMRFSCIMGMYSGKFTVIN
jgi:plastocyanin